MRLVARYLTALREEPKLRAYTAGSFVDDVGVAVSSWAGRLLFLALFTDQHQRAKLMVPSLICFLAGTLIAGPLADWAARGTPEQLARWRWRVVVWGRIVETLALALLIRGVADKPTLASVAPYVFVSAFMKTSLRPTRTAFYVDLLTKEQPQLDANGNPETDERGNPRVYKTHMLTMDSMTSVLNSASVLAGLLLGGKILQWAHGRYVPLYAIDVATNAVFIAFILFGCHPQRSAKQVNLREIVRDPEPIAPLGERAHEARRSLVGEGAREVLTSFRETIRFLSRVDQRPLLILLGGSLLFEWIYEFYDAGMIVKNVLHDSDEHFRHIEIAWNCVWLVGIALLPVLARWVKALGKLFAVMMLVDGIVIALVGRMCGAGALTAVAFFLGADRVLTTSANELASLAQNSASSAALRGRLAAIYAFVAIIGDIFAEVVSTALSDAYGTGGMLVRIGIAQVVVIFALTLLGGKRFWTFGLRVQSTAP